MKNKKLILVAVLAAALVVLMACNLAQVESIEFVNKPNSTYTQGYKADASQFKIKLNLKNNKEITVPLNDPRLTVQGLVDGKLDTSSVGTKTITVSYQGITITFTYEVTGGTVEVWKAEDATNGTNNKNGGDLLKALENPGTNGVVTLSGTYDLSGKQWKGLVINDTQNTAITRITADSTNKAVIKNMTITDKTALSDGNFAAGLIGKVGAEIEKNDPEKNAKSKTVTIENLTFENTVIDVAPMSELAGTIDADFKNYGVVIGRVYDGSIAIIEGVTVNGAYIRGIGRLGGIVGANYGTLTINKTNVTATIEGVNPITDSNADGEADKIGGILGFNSGDATIKGCTATVTIRGTRNLGGILGYSSKTLVLTNNTVEAKSVITASVLGGVLPKKGRSVGALIGSLAANKAYSYTITGNKVEEGVVYKVNSAYENDTTSGKFVGGIYSQKGHVKNNLGILTFDEMENTTTTYVYNYECATADVYDYTEIREQLDKLNDELAKVNPGA